MDLQSLQASAEKVLRMLDSKSSNFKFAFLFLSPAQRDGLKRVYDFCRVVDDIVDERPPGGPGREQARAGLEAWTAELERIYRPDSPTGSAQFVAERQTRAVELGVEPSWLPELHGAGLAETIARFNLPRFALEELIAGCEMDLETTTYADLPALELYCYRVASCVGVLCIGIFGDQSEVAQRYAKHLGLALQYTNILRDVGEDAARGRVYLPLDLLARHGLCEQDILACRYDARFLAMAEEFADFAEREYQKAWSELPGVPARSALLPAEIMGRTYYQLLAEIRGSRYNVFTHRAGLRRRDKLKVAGVSIALTVLPPQLSGSLSGALTSFRSALS